MSEIETQYSVDSLQEQYEHLYSEKAKEALKNEFESTVCPNGKIEYMSYVIKIKLSHENPEKELTTGIEKAVTTIINIINDLAAKDHLLGFLSPLSKLNVAGQGTLVVPPVVFCFPAVTHEGSKYLRSISLDCLCEEGAIGPFLDY